MEIHGNQFYIQISVNALQIMNSKRKTFYLINPQTEPLITFIQFE